ncbi:MAG: flavin reductase family protein [Acidimicrobiales bacterium]
MEQAPDPVGPPDAQATNRIRLSYEDPFVTPASQRRQDRRFRGRLVAPVTVWTAGSGQHRAGLTVSSLLVAEGDPAVVIGLLDPLSALFEALVETNSFVVHVLDTSDRRLAAMFAGAYPVDAFEEVETTDGEFGPVINGTRHSLDCTFSGSEEVGFQALVRGRIAAATVVPDAGQPITRYHGRYRELSPEEDGRGQFVPDSGQKCPRRPARTRRLSCRPGGRAAG